MLLSLATLAVALPGVYSAGLHLRNPCGEKSCSRYEYCSDLYCQNCEPVCTVGERNFDSVICEKECQEYIHDKIKGYQTVEDVANNTKQLQGYVRDKIKEYLSEADSLKATKDLQETIEWLRQLVAASLILSLMVVVVVVAALGFLWLRYRRKKAEQNKEIDLMDTKIQTVSGMMNNNCKEKLAKLDMSSIGSNTAAPSVVTGVTTTTPISTRHPCEDATLEYAYDNQGMTPSPILQEQRNETTF
ncbi:uncharacterized protein LOC106667425 [Cimex lectularius]|uniref:Uncharacterized protein n=1 Tax=Cimex lectularius TaxID=79782 RepID=A0A8I6RVG7_CIMLE|nr:uncharacterized protein LOC106667425 [Cimex lectularius]